MSEENIFVVVVDAMPSAEEGTGGDMSLEYMLRFPGGGGERNSGGSEKGRVAVGVVGG